MPETPGPFVREAPESLLPSILVEPPWGREPGSKEPVVVKGLKAPQEPTTMTWAPGRREEWLNAPHGNNGWASVPDDTDWEEAAETFSSGRALSELNVKQRRALSTGLIMQAPLELGEKLLTDERYWSNFCGYGVSGILQGAVARHEFVAYPLAMHAAKNSRVFNWLDPFLDADVAQIMINAFGVYPNGDRAEIWFKLHGQAAARLTVPDALRRPGPKRQRAEDALRLVAQNHGHHAIVEAARFYGDEAEQAIAMLKSDPLDLYPDPLPQLPQTCDPARLPQVLLRGRQFALPATATRHLIMMMVISELGNPYPGLPPLIELFDPDSLAEFVWALYEARPRSDRWAAPGVQHALIHFGDDRTADRLAPIVAGWSKSQVWSRGGTTALRLFTRLGTDSALRHLHRLAQKAQDQKRIRPEAQGALNRIAKERGLAPEQLADRLVPHLGLDADGGMILDYGQRHFVVGFDEQLKPFVTDQDGKLRKTLPKPGIKDDNVLAPAAYQRFADLKKEVRTLATEQIKRLEKAMTTGRGWTSEEFRTLFVEHPLLWHIARRLVWSAEAEGRTTSFRIAEDRTLADVDDNEYTLPDAARVTLPHPLIIGLSAPGIVDAWSQVLADYEILQPFPQLGRAIHTLTEQERPQSRLERFEGRTTHFGRILGMTSRGWELGEKETGGFRRQIMFMTPDDRHVMVQIEPGVRVMAPEEFPEQEIRHVTLLTGRYSGKAHPFGELDGVTASELLAELTRITETAAR